MNLLDNMPIHGRYTESRMVAIDESFKNSIPKREDPKKIPDESHHRIAKKLEIIRKRYIRLNKLSKSHIKVGIKKL